jgi:hypothetical protein
MDNTPAGREASGETIVCCIVSSFSMTPRRGRTKASRGSDYYRAKLARLRSLSHLTIEVVNL